MSDDPKPAEPAAADEKLIEVEKIGDAGSTTTMLVKVYSPYKVYYDGDASSISAASATGPFDILPKHHNFITLLVPCDLLIRVGKETQTVSISGGIMHVKANDVVVFLDV
jgi:F0F1-type ATP synthase epsilon subunit